MAETSGVTLFGPCPCGGSREVNYVDLELTRTDGSSTTLSHVPRGQCLSCGSHVYKSRVLDAIEFVFHRHSPVGTAAGGRQAGESDS